MKVLREGPPWSVEVECPACRSLLLAEEADVVFEPSGGMTLGSLPGVCRVRCPVCKARMVDLPAVPKHVEDAARKRYAIGSTPPADEVVAPITSCGAFYHMSLRGESLPCGRPKDHKGLHGPGALA